MFQDVCSVYILRKYILLVLLILCHSNSKAQSAITSITTSNSSVATNSETNIFSAGFPFSFWVPAANFSINYSTDPANDITSITSFNTASFVNFLVAPVPGAIAVIKREPNIFIPDARNFITSWNHISAAPIAGDITGTFDCIAPKVTSMEASLLSNNINSGYDNTFQNSYNNPHYNNIERVDYIIPGGVLPILNLDEIGVAVFDRGVGDDFKIAAITGVDAFNNPTAYSNLVSVSSADFSSAGLLASDMEYTIFVSDPLVASGEHRPSTKNHQNIRGVFISFIDLGIATNQLIYGYSLFGQDVDPGLGHILTNPSTFPTNSNYTSALDLLNITGIYKTNNGVLPVKITSVIASLISNSIQVSWKAFIEDNVQNYVVERSNNSFDWQEINNSIPAYTHSGSSYTIIDRKITGNSASSYFYRIKSVNKDGSKNYSPVVMVETKQSNPITTQYTGNKITVRSNTEIIQAQLFDNSGRIIFSANHLSSTTVLDIPVSNSSRGLYIVSIINKNGRRKWAKVIL